MADRSAASPAARRSYRTALACLAAGSALLIVAYAMPWVSVSVPVLPGADAATREITLAGRDLFPGVAMTGWVSLAAFGGIVATRSWGRTVVAAVGLLAGIGGLVVAVLFAASPGLTLDDAVRRVADAEAYTAGAASGWWAAAAAGGALVAYASAWAAVSGRHWPSLGSRYERTPANRPDASAWDTLDHGADPTEDPDRGRPGS